MPLSRRRVFGGKLYERETGGTANVFLAAETLNSAVETLGFAAETRGERTGERVDTTHPDPTLPTPPLPTPTGERVDLVFKLRDGEVTEEER